MPNEDQLKADYFTWHYENQDAVPADIADYWLERFHEHNKGIVEMVIDKIDNIPIDRGVEIYDEGDGEGTWNNAKKLFLQALEDIKYKLQNNGGTS